MVIIFISWHERSCLTWDYTQSPVYAIVAFMKKRVYIRNDIPSEVRVRVTQHTQLKGTELKMRHCNLRSGVNMYGA
jgi:hypothetical protein